MSTGIELPPMPPPPPAAVALADAEFESPRGETPVRTCPNCGAPAHGPFCYACGQSEKGMIRHLSEVMADLADIVFNVDSRIFRSLGELYVRPGYLTTEYLAGRRARYVTPFRLFFFLTVIAFFAIQAAIPEDAIKFDNDSLASAETPEQVTEIVDKAIAEMTTARNVPGLPKPAIDGIEKGMQEVRDKGLERIVELKDEEIEAAGTPEQVTGIVDEAIAQLTVARNVPGLPRSAIEGIDKGMQKVRDRGARRVSALDREAPATPGQANSPAGKNKNRNTLRFDVDGRPWDAETNPVRIDWLPDGLNGRINHTLSNMEKNIESARKDPGRLLAGWFAVLPQTLFVVMPFFAVLLKVFYIFKRRLYMEHLLVALHSHAFIFLSVLVILLLGLLGEWVADIAWLAQPVSWLRALAWIWLFVYLLLMQKRVYRQGWFMTTMKYCLIGFCYTIFLSVALAFAALVSLALT